MWSATAMSGCGTNGAPIKPVTSAYQHFMSEQYREHKGDFADMAVGQAAAEVSRRWSALDERGKAKYLELTAQDRARHERECRARDEEVAARQAANREARHADPISQGYMRARQPAEPKKERRVTREEDLTEEQLETRRRLQEKRDAAKASRLEREAESSRQKDSIAQAAAAMARKR